MRRWEYSHAEDTTISCHIWSFELNLAATLCDTNEPSLRYVSIRPSRLRRSTAHEIWYASETTRFSWAKRGKEETAVSLTCLHVQYDLDRLARGLLSCMISPLSALFNLYPHYNQQSRCNDDRCHHYQRYCTWFYYQHSRRLFRQPREWIVIMDSWAWGSNIQLAYVSPSGFVCLHFKCNPWHHRRPRGIIPYPPLVLCKDFHLSHFPYPPFFFFGIVVSVTCFYLSCHYLSIYANGVHSVYLNNNFLLFLLILLINTCLWPFPFILTPV